MSEMKKMVLSGLSILLVLGQGCSRGFFLVTHLTPAIAYGEYWTKPGMAIESWRQDWINCGGWSDGQYSVNVPPGSSNAVSSVLWGQARKKLDTCMESKGYEFSYKRSVGDAVYGTYWTKPGMTIRSWERDWLKCGGKDHGEYIAKIPPGSSVAVDAMIWEQVRKELDACMKSKGYEFNYTGPRDT